MNKKLIAAAVVAGLAAPMAAQADVSVYGLAQLELTSLDSGNGSKTGVTDSKNTRVGVRWNEDLGGGLKALGEFEFAPNAFGAPANSCAVSLLTATGPNQYTNLAPSVICSSSGQKSGIYARQAWMGLKGGFGEFQVGTVLQPYKYSGGVKYDAFVATAAEARSNHGGMIPTHFGQGGYFSQALAYKKAFGAVKFWIAYSPSETSDSGHAYKGTKGDLMASLVFGFSGGEVGVAYAKDNNKSGTTGPDGEKNTKIFGKYSFGNNTVLAQYEQAKDSPYFSGDGKVYFLGYRLKLPAMNMLAVQYGQSKADAGGKLTYTAVGVRHSFSKKTSTFLAWRKSSPDGGNDQKAITLGLTEKF